MTTIVGGLRQRLIRDSIYNMVHASLQSLGWFDSGRQHLPIQMRPVAVHNDEEVALNTLAVSPEEMPATIDAEMGTGLGEHRRGFYVDFYAENEALGEHLMGDVKDILDGRMPSIGRGFANTAVYDYRQATPPLLFYVELEDVEVDRAHDFPKAWQKCWYAARFTVVDYYGSDAD